MTASRIVVFLCCALFASAASGQPEHVSEIPIRDGQRLRVLVSEPAAPIGSIILLAGGHGNISITEDGRIGWGAGNQLVRTRAQYAKAGFVTAVPDIAPDLKEGRGVKQGYRWSEAHARDLGALVKHLRTIASPVYVVGTSRAALSVANAAVRLSGEERPDAIVITSGMLMHAVDGQPSVERNIGGLHRIRQPTLIIYHEDDACPYTLPASAEMAKKLLTTAEKVDIILVKGGEVGSGDACEAQSPHGFVGQDQRIVEAVTSWLKAQRN